MTNVPENCPKCQSRLETKGTIRVFDDRIIRHVICTDIKEEGCEFDAYQVFMYDNSITAEAKE